MYIKMELNSLDDFNAWSGGLDTLDDVRDADKIEQLDELFQELFYSEIPTETEVNDWLWFERDYIYESLGIAEDENEKQKDTMEELDNE